MVVVCAIASTFALDENTGQLKWYWQEAHHDNWDLDHGGMPTLENITINGKVYPALMSCNKAGNCEVLDRRNGSPLPNFPMKETPVQDPSGKGLALNNEYPTARKISPRSSGGTGRARAHGHDLRCLRRTHRKNPQSTSRRRRQRQLRHRDGERLSQSAVCALDDD